MDRPKVLLVVPDGELRAKYEMILRFCGLEPVSVAGRDLDDLPEGTIAGCVLTDHRSGFRGCARASTCRSTSYCPRPVSRAS